MLIGRDIAFTTSNFMVRMRRNNAGDMANLSQDERRFVMKSLAIATKVLENNSDPLTQTDQAARDMHNSVTNSVGFYHKPSSIWGSFCKGFANLFLGRVSTKAMVKAIRKYDLADFGAAPRTNSGQLRSDNPAASL